MIEKTETMMGDKNLGKMLLKRGHIVSIKQEQCARKQETPIY